MINLRYHIVSITAVFLALAIGIAMGSTFIDKATVDQLKRNIDGVEAKANRVDAENAKLRSQVDGFLGADAALTSAGLPRLLAGTLTGAPLLVLVGLDVGDTTVKQVQALVIASGAHYEGTLRLDERLRKLSAQGDDAVKLASILGVDTTDPARLLQELAHQLGALLSLASRRPAGETPAPPPATTAAGNLPGPATTAPAAPLPTSTPFTSPLIGRLVDAGFFDFEPPPGDRSVAPGLVAPDQRVIVLGAPVPAPPAGTLDLNRQLIVPALQAATHEGGVEVVAASSLDDADDTSNPGAVQSLFVGPLRSDKSVAGRLSTVDDLGQPNGLVALMLAMKEAAEGRYGQYGVGADATAPLPGG